MISHVSFHPPLPSVHPSQVSAKLLTTRWMATSPVTSFQRPRLSLDDLSSELLSLIFRQLRDIDAQSLGRARSVCRWFEATATPVFYHTLVLNESIVAADAEQRYPHALEHIYVHTNHVFARSDLDPQGIKKILDGVQRLATVTWRYVNDEFCSGRFWLPSDVLSPRQGQLCKTKLFVEGLPLREFRVGLESAYIRSIPTNILVSLKMARPTHPVATSLSTLKQLVLASPQLQTFHYEDRGQGTQFEFSPGERLPAFQDLILKHYDWRHSREDVATHWDLSRLHSLELVSVPIFNVLSSISFPDLAGLHTLHAEDFSAHLPDRRTEATNGLYLLVKTTIRALHTLHITVHTRQFPIDAILRHAPTLRSLHLRDHVGFGDEGHRCPTLWVDDLATLAGALTGLHTLELDMDSTLTDPPLFLAALGEFPALHTLTLHVQTVLRPHEVMHPGSRDRDYDAAVGVFGILVRGKKRGGEEWRSITLNVGGWKKVMVRRLGQAWRAHNELGVFAERCFVLERLRGRGGEEELGVREEYSLPSPRTETPPWMRGEYS